MKPFQNSPQAIALTTLGLALSCAQPAWAQAPVAPVTSGQGAFNRKAWLGDYVFLKQQLERAYANLAWFASPQSPVDLRALDRRTLRALNTAENDEDAKAALLGFVEGFHDGHLRPVARLEVANGKPANPPKAALDDLSAADAAAAMGYAPTTSVAFSLPFESLKDSRLESDGLSRVFRAGVVTLPHGARLGILRIPRFREQDAPPAASMAEWTLQKKAGQPIDAGALRAKVSQAWFQTLADQLRSFKQEGVAAVLVDVGGNGGGNDSGDWAARLFTAGEVHSAPLLVAASSAGKGYFDEQIQELRKALQEPSKTSLETKALLQKALAGFEQRKAALDAQTWDLSWVWREQRPWHPTESGRLVDAGYASGYFDYLPVASTADREALASAYWAVTVDPFRGAWSGPVYVLTDGRTGSSAEMFTATMRDNRIARIIGIPTVGAGAGFMFDEAPVELPHSRLRFQLPNCVRLRADGTDEVVGIQPDLPVLPRQGENARARAARVLESIEADLRATAH